MKLKWSENFLGVKGRAGQGVPQRGLGPAETSARIRWVCSEPGCELSAATYPRDNARLYTYLPHRGPHKRVGLRVALLRRRNSVESVIGELKRRGIGLNGQQHPRWVSSDRPAQWLAGAALLGQTLRRLSHETGLYGHFEADAARRCLLKL